MALTSQSLHQENVGEVWNQICSASELTTFFHTRTWAEVLSASFPRWSTMPIALEFSDGNLMVLPLMQRKKWIPTGRYGESMLPGVYGGPVFMHAPSEEHWQVLWSAVNKFSNIIIFGNPFLPEFGSPNAVRRAISTQVLDLTPGIDQILKSFRKGHRADLKAARKMGVEVKVASSIEEVDAYFEIYQGALARWGKKASGFYPRQLFHNLFRLPEYGNSVKLWLALHQNKVIAGALLFYHNVHVVYWHGAANSNYMSYHPVHLLVTAAIEESSLSGFRWFDFNPSGGFKGVEHFKSGFGTQSLEFFAYRRLNAAGKAFRLCRYLKESHLRKCAL
jgi:hypothetical protein